MIKGTTSESSIIRDIVTLLAVITYRVTAGVRRWKVAHSKAKVSFYEAAAQEYKPHTVKTSYRLVSEGTTSEPSIIRDIVSHLATVTSRVITGVRSWKVAR